MTTSHFLHEVWGVAASILVSVGSAGAIIAGVSKWTGHLWAEKALEKDRHRYSTELEELKSRYDSSARRVQAFLDTQSFTKELHRKLEFEALTSIWRLVSDTRSEMGHLQRTLGLVTLPEGQSHYAWYLERFPKFTVAAQALTRAVHSMSPFYPQNIYNKLTEAVIVAKTEMLEGAQQQPGGQPPTEWWGTGQRNSEEFVRLAEEISQLVRDRLRTLGSLDAPLDSGDSEDGGN